MTNKEYKIWQQEQALDTQKKEYIENFDSYDTVTNKELLESIKATENELNKLKKERKKDAIRHVQLQQEIKN